MSDMENYERACLREDARIDAESDYRDAQDEERATLRRQLEHAPALGTFPVSDALAGWLTPMGAFVCVQCAGRILARGCALPRASTPVWGDDRRTASASCIGCSHGEI